VQGAVAVAPDWIAAKPVELCLALGRPRTGHIERMAGITRIACIERSGLSHCPLPLLAELHSFPLRRGGGVTSGR
jgi:hypothetical protein